MEGSRDGKVAQGFQIHFLFVVLCVGVCLFSLLNCLFGYLIKVIRKYDQNELRNGFWLDSLAVRRLQKLQDQNFEVIGSVFLSKQNVSCLYFVMGCFAAL